MPKNEDIRAEARAASEAAEQAGRTYAILHAEGVMLAKLPETIKIYKIIFGYFENARYSDDQPLPKSLSDIKTKLSDNNKFILRKYEELSKPINEKDRITATKELLRYFIIAIRHIARFEDASDLNQKIRLIAYEASNIIRNLNTSTIDSLESNNTTGSLADSTEIILEKLEGIRQTFPSTLANAAFGGDYKTCDLLLNAGVKLETRNKSDKSGLDYETIKLIKDIRVLELLLDKGAVNCSPNSIIDALKNFLTQGGNEITLQILQLLINKTSTPVDANAIKELCNDLKSLKGKDLSRYNITGSDLVKEFIRGHARLSDTNSAKPYLDAFWDDPEIFGLLMDLKTPVESSMITKLIGELIPLLLSPSKENDVALSNKTRQLKAIIGNPQSEKVGREETIAQIIKYCDDLTVKNFIDNKVDLETHGIFCLKQALDNPDIFDYLLGKGFTLNDLAYNYPGYEKIDYKSGMQDVIPFSSVITDVIENYCNSRDTQRSRSIVNQLLDKRNDAVPDCRRPDLPHKLILTGDTELVGKYLGRYPSSVKARIHEDDKKPYYLYKLILCIAEALCWITIFLKAHRMAKGDKLMQTVIAGKAWPEEHYDSLLHSAAKITDLDKAREMMSLLKTRCPDLLPIKNTDGKTAEALLSERELKRDAARRANEESASSEEIHSLGRQRNTGAPEGARSFSAYNDASKGPQTP